MYRFFASRKRSNSKIIQPTFINDRHLKRPARVIFQMTAGQRSISFRRLIILLVLALFVQPSGVRATNDHPIHHRLVPQRPPSVSGSGGGGGGVRKRDDPKPLRVTNGCQETIHPAISTQAGIGPETNGFELSPGRSRLLTVSSDWQGRVWGRTNCSFNAAGTGASNRGGLDGGGRACRTGDCGGIVNCRLAVRTCGFWLFLFSCFQTTQSSC